MTPLDRPPQPRDVLAAAERVFELAAAKARSLDRSWDAARGTPVFTVRGKYATRGWTEWTQGFQYGCMILAGDAAGDASLVELGKRRTVDRMLPHVTHTGVHDHAFNNLSTYGNLLRLLKEHRMPYDGWEELCYRNAVAASGAVQAARWSGVPVAATGPDIADSPGLGYVASFNGPHSLFVDTMRTTRVLSAAWRLGHALMHEGDRSADLLKRAVLHGLTTNRYVIFHGRASERPAPAGSAFVPPYAESHFNVRGRTAHEAVFNRNDGAFRCRSTQQGYSPFSTWTRGLSWAMLGYAEHLEFFATVEPGEFKRATGLSKAKVVRVYDRAARETCDHYLCDAAAADGVPYWDDGAPGLAAMPGWRDRPADPFNEHEPVDASAAAVAAQALVRLGNYYASRGNARKADAYRGPGLALAATLFDEPYLSTKKSHQGLLLHSIYHWPNRWDHVPEGASVSYGESSLWGDYHLLELACLVARMADPKRYGPYPTFFSGL